MTTLPDDLLEVVADADGYQDRAIYSRDMRYRYLFERRWGSGDAAVWVLLNPATGDTDRKPRPTLGRCIARSRDWGHGAIKIVNLFAFRATKPRDLLLADDPIGPYGDNYLHEHTADAPRVVAAWGSHGELLGRGRAVASRLPRGTLCLGLTRTLQPRHPLYVPASRDLMVLDPWKDDHPRFQIVD
jgi:hypothetical protein